MPLHFSVDPGPHHVWADDDGLKNVMKLGPSEQLHLLNSYLDLVRVPLPEWLIDPPILTPSTPPPLGNVTERSSNCGHIVNVDDCDGTSNRPRVKSTKQIKQIQNVAKQFGSIGKKLKKNIGNISKLARNGSFGKGKAVTWRNGTDIFDHSASRKIVSGCQSFILCAVILTTDNLLPYQDEMIENYLQVNLQ